MVNNSASRGALTPTNSKIEGNLSMNIYYVYAYTYKDGWPYYIGKGNRAYTKHNRNLLPEDKSCIVILQDKLAEKDALDLEVKLIESYGRIDLNTGPLRNLTNGGEGASGSTYRQRINKEWERYCNLPPEIQIQESEEFWKNK
jgi:hypothetical protein